MAYYKSGEAPKSAIINSTFVSKLTSIFGYKVPSKKTTDFERKYGLEFVRVDLGNDAYRIYNAEIGSIFEKTPLTSNLEKYFDSYLNDNMISYADIHERQARLNMLSDMYYNEVYISRVVNLVADEATQLDAQNRILAVESPNLAFTQRCYELFSIWGITAQRIHKVCMDLELYGEAFWANKITPNSGVVKIIPVSVNNVMERLEFSPEKMAKYLAERDGYMKASQNRSSKVKALVDLIKANQAVNTSENFADVFDTKLLGFELHDGLVVPPWALTHFRYDADSTEFFPYGRPPLLHCLTPYKQMWSTMTLQGLARMMSFPLTLYKVKVPEGTSPGRAFDIVNEVREEFDNLGVSPSSVGSEVYTVNTKIWMPEGLLDIDTKENKIDIGSVDDLELYMKRMASAAGVPKGYLDPTEESWGVSGIALMEQYKPFARHVSEIQQNFLAELGTLIRLHFAITGEFDYNTPFILSMRFPAKEMSEEQRNGRTASMELTTSIMELLKTSLGLADDEGLPVEVVKDILTKYTFLDPTDIQKWMASTLANVATSGKDDEDGEGGGGDAEDIFGGGDDSGGGDDLGGGDEGGADAEMTFESMNREEMLRTKKVLKERSKFLKRMTEERKKTIQERYKKFDESIYFKFLESNGFTSWKCNGFHHNLIPAIKPEDPLYESALALTGATASDNPYARLQEKTLTEVLEEKRNSNAMAGDELINRALEREIGVDFGKND